MAHIAELVGVTPAEVLGTASFYEMFKMEPVGRYMVNICTNIACQLLGGEELLDIGHEAGTRSPENLDDRVLDKVLGRGPVTAEKEGVGGQVTAPRANQLSETFVLVLCHPAPRLRPTSIIYRTDGRGCQNVVAAQDVVRPVARGQGTQVTASTGSCPSSRHGRP